MLSNEIYNLRQRYHEFTHAGVMLSGNEVAKLIAIFHDLEEQAQKLELSEVPVPLTLNAAHLVSGKVLSFPVIPRKISNDDGVAS